jgi:glycine betaine/choline ABC-type transport system substrate-binding protein
LGGNLCHQALISKQIDCYAEYTGTAYTEILDYKPQSDVAKVYEQVKADYARKFEVEASPPLGFSNGFAMLIRGADARRLGITKLSQAAPHAKNWVAGFGPDFITRADGYPGLSKAYNLRFSGAPRSMDLALINRALAAGKVDIIAGNETDGLIPKLDLFQLQDDLQYFPPYQGVYLTRREALQKWPALREVFEELAGAISTEEMQKMNYAVDGEKRAIPDVARSWREQKL